MRRLGYIVAALLALGGVVRADQGWQDNQDGNNFECYDAQSFAANNINLSGGAFSTFGNGLIVNDNPNASVSSWFIDPVGGSDSNAGTSSGHPLKTNKEWSRRMRGAFVVAPVVTWMNDIPDADSLVIPTNGLGVEFLGSETVLSTQTVTSAQPRTAASNLANEITVTGFNWTPFLNDFVRVQGTQNYAAIVKVVGTGVARLSELWNTSTVSQASSTGIGAGSVVEICKPTKGPLSVSSTGTGVAFFEDIAFDGTGSVSMSFIGQPEFYRVILGGSTSATISAASGGLWNAGLIKQSAVIPVQIMEGTAFSGATVSVQTAGDLSGIIKMRSIVAETTVFTLVNSAHVDADFGEFDIPAAGRGLNLPGSLSTGEGAVLTFNSGRHYGTGDPASWFWSIGNTTKVFYNSAAPPTNTAGLGVAINGGNVALSSLPVLYSVANDTAAIDNTATAGCLQQDASGNVVSTGVACGGGSGTVVGPLSHDATTPSSSSGVASVVGLTSTGAVDHPIGTLTNSQCMALDSGGNIVTVACSAGGTVTSVNGTAGQILCTPTSPNPVCSLVAAGTAGSCTNCSVTFDSLGRETAQTSGTAPVTSVGVIAPITTTGGTSPSIGISLPASQIACGTGTNVTSSANLAWNGTQFVAGAPLSSIPSSAQAMFFDNSTGQADVLVMNPDSTHLSQEAVRLCSDTSCTNSLLFGLLNQGWGATVPPILAAGQALFENETAAGGMNMGVITSASTAAIRFYTGAGRTVRWSVENAGQLQTLAMAAPSTPASGQAVVYVDSTSKNLAVKSDAGTVNHAVQSKTCSAGQFLNEVDDTGATVCGTPAGGGTVTSVTGADGVVCSPTSPNPTCTLANLTCGANTFVSSASSGSGLVCTQPSFANLSGSATCAQLPALTGDVTSSAGTCGTTLANIPSGTPAAGSITFTEGSTPSLPAAGKLACWASSSSDNFGCRTSSNVISTLMEQYTCGASTWAKSSNTFGFTSCTQPNFTDLAGSTACSQLPALTGDTTSTAGGCGTKVVEIHESGGLGIPIGACTTDGQAFVKVAGSMTCRLPSADLSNDYTAPWVVGMHDGASVDWTTSGAWASGKALTLNGTNIVATNPASLATTQRFNIIYNLQDFVDTGGFGALWLLSGPVNTGNTDGSATEYPAGLLGTFVRVMARVSLNTLAGGVGSGPTVLQVTRNGSNVTGALISIPLATTGNFDSGLISVTSSSAGDTYGLFPSGSSPLGGVITATISVIVLGT